MKRNLITAAIFYIIGFGLIQISFLSSEHRLLIEKFSSIFGLITWSIFPTARTILFFVGITCLGTGYLLLLRWAVHNPSLIRYGQSFVAFLLLLFLFLPPFLSLDVISYYQQGWVAVYQKANPYLNSPGDFTNPLGKDFLYKGYNLHALTPYGPIWTAIESFIYWVSNGSLLFGIIFFKILATIASLILVFAISKITRIISPKNELLAIIFLGANPLLLIEGPAMAHLDVTVLAMVALGIWLQMHFRSKVWISALFLTTAALIKAYATPALFLFFWWIVRDDSRPVENRVWSIIQTMTSVAGLFVATSIPYITSLSDISRLFGLTKSMVNLEVPFTPVFILKKFLGQSFNQLSFSFSTHIIGNIAQSLVIVLVFAFILYLIRHVRTIEAVGIAIGPLYIVVNLALIFWRPWYALWPLALIAILPCRKWAIVIALYSWLALSTYVITHSSGVSLFH